MENEYYFSNIETQRLTPKTSFVVWIQSSAFAASLKLLFLFLLFALAWFLLFDFAIETAFPTLFPISDFVFIVLVSIMVFVMALYIAYKKKIYREIVQSYAILCGFAETFAQQFVGLVLVEDSPQANLDIFTEVSSLSRKIPFAVLLQYSTYFNLASKKKYQRHKSLPTLELRHNYNSESRHLLPLDEIENISRWTDNMEAINNKLHSHLLTLASKGEHILNQVYHIRLVDTLSEMHFYLDKLSSEQILHTIPIVEGYLKIIVWVWSFFLPWVLWGQFRWWGLLIYIFIAWPFLALVEVSNKLSDPFVPYQTSSYVWHNLHDIARMSSETVDQIFGEWAKNNNLQIGNKTTPVIKWDFRH